MFNSVWATVSTVAFGAMCSTGTAAVTLTCFTDSAGVKGSIGVLAFICAAGSEDGGLEDAWLEVGLGGAEAGLQSREADV